MHFRQVKKRTREILLYHSLYTFSHMNNILESTSTQTVVCNSRTGKNWVKKISSVSSPLLFLSIVFPLHDTSYFSMFKRICRGFVTYKLIMLGLPQKKSPNLTSIIDASDSCMGFSSLCIEK